MPEGGAPVATKYEYVNDMYEHMLNEITESPTAWTAFLRSACRNYKCRFDEQVLIHAQRPDATAVLEIDKWNKQFGRWVNKGAKGIAVFGDGHRGRKLLKHYFDVSDTHGSSTSRTVPVWNIKPEFDDEVIESLENSFGDVNDRVISSALFTTANNAIEDNITDYLQDLMDSREGSNLDGVNESDVESRFRKVVVSSVAYMLFSRCGINPKEHYDKFDFSNIADFNTIGTVNSIGIASSDISEMILREISATVINLQKQTQEQNRTFANPTNRIHNEPIIENNNERGVDNGTNIQNRERLSNSEPRSADDRAGNTWKIRTTQEEISKRTPQNFVRESSDNREVEQSSIGNRTGRQRDDGNDNQRDGSSGERDGRAESNKHDEVGRIDEQHQSIRRGNDTERPDIQLESLPTVEKQLSLVEKAEEEKTSAFSISQQIIDEVLTSGGNELDSTLRIVAFFKKDHVPLLNTDYLKNEYGTGGKGFIFDGIKVSVWFDESGIRIAHGNTVNSANVDVVLITWEQAAKRTRELLDIGRYMSQQNLDKVDEFEIKSLAEKIWYLQRDCTNSESFAFMDSGLFNHGFPDDTVNIAKLLNNPDKQLQILKGMDQLANKIEQDESLLRFRGAIKNLNDSLDTLEDLQREKLTFYADESIITATPSFITQDEIDHVLFGGSNMEDGKFRIYSHFLKTNTIKENVDFLKKEYGTTGGYGRTGFSKSNSSKGITITREINNIPYDNVLVSWNIVANRISKLISENRYMTQEELDHIPKYEKKILAGEIYHFFSCSPKEVFRPYPREEIYYQAVRTILPQLDSKERVREIVEQMIIILGSTADTDRHYEVMRKACNDLTAFLNDTYSLFSPVTSIESTQSRVDDSNTANQNAEEPKITEPKQYTFYLGATVYIGTEEFEISEIGDDRVVLYDVNAPLFVLEMPRSEFDEKVAENPMNDHLLSVVSQKPENDIHISESPQVEQIRDVLSMRGYIVSDELLEVGVDEYDTDNYTDDVKGIADYIEDNLLNADTFDAEHENETQPQITHFDIPTAERHNFRITDDDLGVGGQKTKFRANIDAISILKSIESENRLATPDEQEILSRYVGWGALQQAFDANNTSWVNENLELRSLLSEDEYTAARASTLNAYYTSPVVIKAIYKAIENMGFKTGNILEPSCGIGNFLGLLPDSMSESKVYGIEIDSITGRIAQQLYQQSNIAIQGFETTDMPDSFFDLAIGNVPFGSYKLLDKKYDKHNFNVHDYFFAKTLDKVRPGGIVAFVTSMYTMDKQNSKVRKYIAERADLLGAIRLPNNAFSKNAGTEATADIIFLQKRDRITDIEPDWVHLGKTDDDLAVNSYFIENPEMVLGTLSKDSGTRMYGSADSVSCVAFPDTELSDLLSDAITNIHAEYTDYEHGDDELEEDSSLPADPTIRNFSYTLVDGKIYYRQDSRMFPVDMSLTAQNRVKGLIKLRECVRKLITYQTEDYPDSYIIKEQANLNSLYDKYTKKYGLINSRGNSMAFAQDSSYALLCALEVLDENGELERKADMFTKRTIKPYIPITHVDTAAEALAVSLSEKARIDIPFMSELSGISKDDLIRELEGVIFLNVGTGELQNTEYVTADEYLSGNVREKLALAKAATTTVKDGSLDINVTSLEAVVPEDLNATEISARLGATWLPPDVVQEFVYQLLKTPLPTRDRIKVFFSDYTGAWRISDKSADRSNVNVFNTYGTQRVNAYHIIEQTLNLRDARVFDKTYDEQGKEKRVLNKKETAIAMSKQDIIRQKFDEWIWSDPDRRDRLCRIYNDKFNSICPRIYDGNHLTFPGMNPEIVLRKHQIDAIARIIYGGNTLLAHDVGAGKTFCMAAAAMKLKQIGLCNKSLFVVPNHITEQWAGEFMQLYPSANILVATKKDFETKNRKKFCARIATGDYDAIIIGHSQFEKIPMSIERQQASIKMQISELVSAIEELKLSRGENFSIKQLEGMKKKLSVKLAKLNNQSRKDDVVTFEELGIDRLFVDEAHNYKNLYITTKMRNVGGIGQSEAQKSSDLFMKCRYLDELTNGRGTIFATGTPISNSMVELYTMQRYLQYETLLRHNLAHFDAWASIFGETITAIELAPEGIGYRAKTRFAKFHNLPELMSMFRSVADIQTADMLNLPVPKANFHTEVLQPSELQKEMIAQLAERAEAIRSGVVDPREDNMLRVTSDGRKLALDQRIINPMLPDDPDGKVSKCANNIFRIWEDTKTDRLAQLVFSDLSTPKSDGTFNVYDDLRDKLIAKGVPEHEIAFIHNADTEVRKKELFAKVRKGQIRVLLGSTQKMGAGTNVQNKLVALHDADCPWRPSDLAQRLGRIVRQGNTNPAVQIFRYVTEGTFDSYLYQLVENKQKFIAQIMTSKTPIRSAEDVDETALSYAEIKALATGNPLIIEKSQLEMDVNKLKILHASHLSQKYALEHRVLKEYPQSIERLTGLIEGYKADRVTVENNTPTNKDIFPPMTIGGISYAEKAKAGQAILAVCGNKVSTVAEKIGEYRGFEMMLSFDSFSTEFKLKLCGAIGHEVALGTDVHGNITRIDNALEGMESKQSTCENNLINVKEQLETAQGELSRPFAQEQEYTEKSARLKEVNILLGMGEKDNTVFDAEPDEDYIEPQKRVREMVR